ncbi:hypothetical protein CROQUDRAFT_100062 [Cronartium quercuum f. sp. fusiforme G11]|uniref:Uncharacterized protein n=1 Tax=Cronartium quercuum f. sp. fusiforme G11 TaxID=708437 RepID=A0A9P6NA07_9BASI|nr:hypothetical protein CROQUDRAFT_100062 [Cronartium quercuum f. sp. fusiforme G11]
MVRMGDGGLDNLVSHETTLEVWKVETDIGIEYQPIPQYTSNFNSNTAIDHSSHFVNCHRSHPSQVSLPTLDLLGRHSPLLLQQDQSGIPNQVLKTGFQQVVTVCLNNRKCLRMKSTIKRTKTNTTQGWASNHYTPSIWWTSGICGLAVEVRICSQCGCSEDVLPTVFLLENPARWGLSKLWIFVAKVSLVDPSM